MGRRSNLLEGTPASTHRRRSYFVIERTADVGIVLLGFITWVQWIDWGIAISLIGLMGFLFARHLKRSHPNTAAEPPPSPRS